jgi:gliding motility-associated-like protein
MEAFSPNGDGKNDRFLLRDLSETGFIERAEIVIVNRMGSEVYRHRNYKVAQEDESQAFTAKGLPEGTYFYRLTVHFNDGSPSATRGGFITVRRGRWE